MPKVAQRYHHVDPWLVTEQPFYPQRSQQSESVFSLANEYMGVRGYFVEEGYSGRGLLGSYFNGVYAAGEIPHPHVFKGMPTVMHFMVNAVDWLWTRIKIDGEQLDLAGNTTTLSVARGPDVKVDLYGKTTTITSDGVTARMPATKGSRK